VVSDILDRLAESHMRLAEGQGAELVWRDAQDKAIPPVDCLRIYALKTAPAFEAALYAGLRLAGPVDGCAEAVRQLAKDLGIAFQILNDLKDWQVDEDNKLAAGQDVLQRRPTILWALAMESLPATERRRMESLLTGDRPAGLAIELVRRCYRDAGVFAKAHRLVDKYQQRAEAVADEVEPESLRRLFYYLIDTVLERPADDAPPLVPVELPSGLPVVA
jgi:geranylgeranyl pyrophosphate synthase